MQDKKITSTLISVFSKDGLTPILDMLAKNNVQLIATGGTRSFIEHQGYSVKSVESITGYPSILGGRVKTLHPAIFGGILSRRHHAQDMAQAQRHDMVLVDMVLVDLYPVEETIAMGKTHEDVIEKIDIGGVTLIRAAAKNYRDVLTVSSRTQYPEVERLLQSKNCCSNIEDRKRFATSAFTVTSHYDSTIQNYFCKTGNNNIGPIIKPTVGRSLRYGENPHQKGTYYGDLEDFVDCLHGNKLSYNNLVDIDAALNLVNEFVEDTVFVIIKHTNACGLAKGSSVENAYRKALQADPLSAFGGMLMTNKPINLVAAKEINKIFFDVLIAPSYTAEALTLLQSKKNSKVLRQKKRMETGCRIKTILNGILEQDPDTIKEGKEHIKTVTKLHPSKTEIKALLFANTIVKHMKSNAIVLATEDQMIANGVGQTSRIDALNQAIEKAKRFQLDLTKAVMASDAFFPFPDCIEVAYKAGIRAVIQPGGSIRDQLSIRFCDDHNMTMVMTGFRHFKH